MKLKEILKAIQDGVKLEFQRGGEWRALCNTTQLPCMYLEDDFATRLKPLSVTLNGTEYSVQKSCLTVALPEEFYFNGDGKVYSRVSQVPSRYVQNRVAFGNRFATKDAAETAANLVKVLLDTMKG